MSWNNIIPVDLLLTEECECCGNTYAQRIMTPVGEGQFVCKFCLEAGCGDEQPCKRTEKETQTHE